MFGPLLEVQMSKKCTLLWREAHFEVKSVKNWRSRTAFGSWDVEKVPPVVARSTFRSQTVQNTPRSDNFWKLRCQKSASTLRSQNVQSTRASEHFWTDGFGVNYTTLTTLHPRHYTTTTATTTTTLHYTNYITLQYSPLRYTRLHSITQHYTTLTTTATTLHYTT